MLKRRTIKIMEEIKNDFYKLTRTSDSGVVMISLTIFQFYDNAEAIHIQ